MELGKGTSSSTPADRETSERPSHQEASKVGGASELDGGTFGRARVAGWAEGEAGANPTIIRSMPIIDQYRPRSGQRSLRNYLGFSAESTPAR